MSTDPLSPTAREALERSREHLHHVHKLLISTLVAEHFFAAGMDFQRSEDAHPDLRAGMLARGFIVGRNPDGVDDTVAATLLVLDDLKARAVSVERERDEALGYLRDFYIEGEVEPGIEADTKALLDKHGRIQ